RPPPLRTAERGNEEPRSVSLAEAQRIYERLCAAGIEPAISAAAADRLGLVEGRAGGGGAFAAAREALLARGDLDAASRFALERRASLRALGPDPRGLLRAAPGLELSLAPAGHAGPKALYRGASGEPLTVEEATLEALGG